MPATREILHVDEVVMAFGLRAVPAFDRAGNVEHRLPVPGGDGLLGRFLLGQAIRVAAVMMHVVDQRHALGLADRQQIGGRESLVVVLDRQPAPDPGRKPVEVAGEIGQRLLLVAERPAAVDVDHIGPDPLGDFGLVFQFPHGRSRPLRAAASSAPRTDRGGSMSAGCASWTNLPHSLEPANDLIAFGQILDRVSACRMRLDRKNLAVDAKANQAAITYYSSGSVRPYRNVSATLSTPPNAKPMTTPMNAPPRNPCMGFTSRE